MQLLPTSSVFMYRLNSDSCVCACVSILLCFVHKPTVTLKVCTLQCQLNKVYTWWKEKRCVENETEIARNTKAHCLVCAWSLKNKWRGLERQIIDLYSCCHLFWKEETKLQNIYCTTPERMWSKAEHEQHCQRNDWCFDKAVWHEIMMCATVSV